MYIAASSFVFCSSFISWNHSCDFFFFFECEHTKQTGYSVCVWGGVYLTGLVRANNPRQSADWFGCRVEHKVHKDKLKWSISFAIGFMLCCVEPWNGPCAAVWTTIPAASGLAVQITAERHTVTPQRLKHNELSCVVGCLRSKLNNLKRRVDVSLLLLSRWRCSTVLLLLCLCVC